QRAEDRLDVGRSAAVTRALVATNGGTAAGAVVEAAATAGRSGAVEGAAGSATPEACPAQPPRPAHASTAASVRRRIGDVPVEPFRIHVADAVLDDLRARIRATRWPDQVPGIGWDQGTESGYL